MSIVENISPNQNSINATIDFIFVSIRITGGFWVTVLNDSKSELQLIPEFSELLADTISPLKRNMHILRKARKPSNEQLCLFCDVLHILESQR